MASALLILLASLPWGSAKVTAVEVDAPGVRNLRRLERVFAVHPGDYLSREAIREGVQSLLATREVEDVWVEVDLQEEGAVVRVHTQVASRVASVRYRGMSSRQRGLLARELKLQVGSPLMVRQFEQALVRTQVLLHADGFPKAELEPILDFDVRSGTVDVTIDAQLGPPQVLCELRADGLPANFGSLWKATEAKPGKRLTRGMQEGMRRRLLFSLRQAGFWQAEVEGPELEGVGCGTRASFRVKTGPHYSLRVEGDQVSSTVLKESFPFLSGEDGFWEGAEDWLAGRLKRALQRQGYLLAQVTVARREEKKGPVMTVGVQRGPKLTVKAIRFPGVSPGSPLETELRQHISVRGGRLTALAGLSWDDDTLLADRESVLAALKTAGYAEAEVAPPRLVRERDDAVLEFPVKLGPRWVIEDVRVENWPEELPQPELLLEAGEGWNVQQVEQSKRRLVAQLQEAGFVEASVVVDGRCASARCNPVFSVTPGPKSRIGRVVVAAMAKTDPEVVEKVIEIREGDPYSPEALVEGQRKLLSLGIFDQVSIRDIPGQEISSRRNVLVEVREAPTHSLTGGIGWDTQEKLRLTAAWTALNLFGRARSLSVEGRFSSRQRRFQLNYLEPAKVAFWGLPTWVAVYRSEENFSTYSLLRRGMWVEVGDHFKRPQRFLLRYDYQIIVPDAPEEVLSGLEKSRQRLRLASLTPIFEWDTRDDLFSPKKGFLVSLQGQRAFPIFLADASFSKLVANVAFFRPLGGSALAFGLRAGFLKPYQGDHHTPDNLRLPLAVRFFAGGRVSHRAFPTDRLGVPGQTLLCRDPTATCSVSELKPVGGAALLLGSAEWRIPVTGSVALTFFTDGGNTWASIGDLRLADVRWGAGAGLRFETPVGPVRLEYGWKLDRVPGESKGELFLSFGNPF